MAIELNLVQASTVAPALVTGDALYGVNAAGDGYIRFLITDNLRDLLNGDKVGLANWGEDSTTLIPGAAGQAIGKTGSEVGNIVSNGVLTIGGDVTLRRIAANTLGMRNGVNAQSQEWFNTWDGSANGELITLKNFSNVGYLATERRGTGLQRPLYMVSAANAAIYCSLSTLFGINYDPTTAGNNLATRLTLDHGTKTFREWTATKVGTYDFGLEAYRWKNGFFGGNLLFKAPAAADALTDNLDCTFQSADNSSFTIKKRGTDGVTRSVTLTLA